MASYKVEMKGTCLLCLNSQNGEYFPEHHRDDSATSFKMLLRYLQVDEVKLIQTATPAGVPKLSSVNLSVALCNECSSLAKDFLELYQVYDSIRLQLDLCVQQLHEFMDKGGKDKHRVREYERRMNVGRVEDLIRTKVAENLRKEITEKVIRKVRSSFPRLSLPGFDVINGEIIDEPSPNSSGTNIITSEACSSSSPPPLFPRIHSLSSTDEAVVQVSEQKGITMDLEIATAECFVPSEEGIEDDTIMDFKNFGLDFPDDVPLRIPRGRDVANTTENGGQRHCPSTHLMNFDVYGGTGDNISSSPTETFIPPVGNSLETLNGKDQPTSMKRKSVPSENESVASGQNLANTTNSQFLTFLPSQARSPTFNPRTSCDYCGNSYSTQSNLRTHQLTNHFTVLLRSTGILPAHISGHQFEEAVTNILVPNENSRFGCPFCEQIFAFKCNLKLHLLRSHTTQIVDIEEGKMRKDAEFPVPANLIHVQAQPKPKRWKCVPCGKTFRYQATFKNHQLSKMHLITRMRQFQKRATVWNSRAFQFLFQHNLNSFPERHWNWNSFML